MNDGLAHVRVSLWDISANVLNDGGDLLLGGVLCDKVISNGYKLFASGTDHVVVLCYELSKVLEDFTFSLLAQLEGSADGRGIELLADEFNNLWSVGVNDAGAGISEWMW